MRWSRRMSRAGAGHGTVAHLDQEASPRSFRVRVVASLLQLSLLLLPTVRYSVTPFKVPFSIHPGRALSLRILITCIVKTRQPRPGSNLTPLPNLPGTWQSVLRGSQSPTGVSFLNIYLFILFSYPNSIISQSGPQSSNVLDSSAQTWHKRQLP